MSNDRKKKDELIIINTHENHKMEYWKKKLIVSSEQLTTVSGIGNLANRVEVYLNLKN